MDETLASKLAEYGIDLPDAMERMDGDEALFKRLALKYLNNTNYVDYVAAMEAKDYDSAYTAAHTLKGVSGNLSFANLFKVASATSEALHQGEYQAAQEMMPDLKAAHDKVIEGLVAWQEGEF
ncbi:MAG: Hpt domain-containing protein [Eggerthellaceae bacterium]|nr:Hpt domain-containing protein [Eggerthellaceae bacterium]